MQHPILLAFAGVILVAVIFAASTIQRAPAYAPHPINPCNKAALRNLPESEMSEMRLFRSLLVGGCKHR